MNSSRANLCCKRNRVGTPHCRETETQNPKPHVWPKHRVARPRALLKEIQLVDPRLNLHLVGSPWAARLRADARYSLRVPVVIPSSLLLDTFSHQGVPALAVVGGPAPDLAWPGRAWNCETQPGPVCRSQPLSARPGARGEMGLRRQHPERRQGRLDSTATCSRPSCWGWSALKMRPETQLPEGAEPGCLLSAFELPLASATVVLLSTRPRAFHWVLGTSRGRCGRTGAGRDRGRGGSNCQISL